MHNTKYLGAAVTVFAIINNPVATGAIPASSSSSLSSSASSSAFASWSCLSLSSKVPYLAPKWTWWSYLEFKHWQLVFVTWSFLPGSVSLKSDETQSYPNSQVIKKLLVSSRLIILIIESRLSKLSRKLLTGQARKDGWGYRGQTWTHCM